MVKAILQKVILYGSTVVPNILVRWISIVLLNVGDEMMLVKQTFQKDRHRQMSVGVMNTCGLQVNGDLLCWAMRKMTWDSWQVDVDEDGFHLISDCDDVSSS